MIFWVNEIGILFSPTLKPFGQKKARRRSPEHSALPTTRHVPRHFVPAVHALSRRCLTLIFHLFLQPGRKPGCKNKKSQATSYSPAYAVPSALKGLTSVFDMGTGGSPSLRSPGNNYYLFMVAIGLFPSDSRRPSCSQVRQSRSVHYWTFSAFTLLKVNYVFTFDMSFYQPILKAGFPWF